MESVPFLILPLAFAAYLLALGIKKKSGAKWRARASRSVEQSAAGLPLGRKVTAVSAVLALFALRAQSALAQTPEGAAPHQPGGEANLKLPDLSRVHFFGVDGHTLLLIGIVICFLGLLFGLMIYTQLKRLPVHKSMREISELIYETCKTYLVTQGKFIL